MPQNMIVLGTKQEVCMNDSKAAGFGKVLNMSN